MVESGPIRLKSGHGKPWGNVACTKFTKALHEAFVDAGLKNQTETAIALGKGKTCQITVSAWLRGKTVPSPREFGNILAAFDPQRDVYDRFVDSYGKLLRPYLRSREPFRVQSSTPIGRWIEKYCLENHLTLFDFSRKTGVKVRGAKLRDRLGGGSLTRLLEVAVEKFELSEGKEAELNEAISRTIFQRLRAGKRLYKSNDLVKEQKSLLPRRTYDGVEAGEELGITRSMISLYRKKLGLPLLLTDAHLEKIRRRLRRKSRGYLSK